MNDHDPQQISLLLDGELDAVAQRRLEEHLERCDECRRTRDAFLAIRRRVTDYDGTVDGLAQRRGLAGVLSPRRAPLWRREIAVPAPVLATLLAALVGVGSLLALERRAPAPGPTESQRVASAPPASAEPGAAPELSRLDRGERPVILVIRHGRRDER